MRFSEPLISTRLIKRYKRFLADVKLPDGSEITVHVPNPGSMLGLTAPGLEVGLSKSKNTNRKLAYTLEMVRADGIWVGVNQSLANALVVEALAAEKISSLVGYTVRREVRYGQNSRIDFLLEKDGQLPIYLEVKNVHMHRPERYPEKTAEWPDSVSARGTKHLQELMHVMKKGARAIMVYVVQRSDCTHFRIAEDLDPVYAKTFKMAREAGLEVLCLGCDVGLEGVEMVRELVVV